jgi:hypothetical protein
VHIREVFQGKTAWPAVRCIAYSPILAGRLGISTTAGLPKVLEAIRIAINASEHGRNQSALDDATQRVQKFRQTMAEKQRAEQLLASEEGATLVSTGVASLWQAIQDVLSTGADASGPVQFDFSKNSVGGMFARTARGMYLAIRATNLYNIATNTLLETRIFRKTFDRFGDATPDDLYLYDAEFKPTFHGHDELAWIDVETSTTYRTEELVSHLVNLFLQHIEEVTSGSR